MVAVENEPIRIWHFLDAPEVYQERFPQGHEDDFLMHIPAGFDTEDLFHQVLMIGRFEECRELEDGSTVYIG